MMFDDLEATRDQLIDQIRAVCKALKYIRSVTALDTLPHFPIAPQLIVVPTPLLNKTFEHMRGPPTLLGWGPTRRRYVQ